VTTSQPTGSDAAYLKEAIALECRRVEEDALYSAKGSFEAARTWARVHLTLGIPTALVAAVAGVSAFNNLPDLAGVLAVLAAALSAVSTFLDPGEKALAYHSAGTRYSSLGARARFLREVTSQTETTPSDQASELKEILTAKDKLNQESPIIPRPAFERARKGIEAGEASYAADRARRR